VSERVLPPVATAIAFIDCINRGDVPALGQLMTEDHALQVFDEAPLIGRQQNIEAWHEYAANFPSYVIYPHRVAEVGGRVAVVGHTTGSHLGLPDQEERTLTLIWVADVEHGLVRSWRLMEDSPKNRGRLGLDLV
jgi:ketosteroid isomerase-like protein